MDSKWNAICYSSLIRDCSIQFYPPRASDCKRLLGHLLASFRPYRFAYVAYASIFSPEQNLASYEC